MTLFDLAEAERRGREGMERAAGARPHALAQAQAIAAELAAGGARVDSDLVAREMQRRGLDYDALGNAAGSVFRSPPKGWRWLFAGAVRKSERVSTHGRLLRVWILEREAADA